MPRPATGNGALLRSATYLGCNLGQQRRCKATDCSTGEQKSPLISICSPRPSARSLAAGRRSCCVDEVVAHLDAERRAYLFGEILGPARAAVVDRNRGADCLRRCVAGRSFHGPDARLNPGTGIIRDRCKRPS